MTQPPGPPVPVVDLPWSARIAERDADTELVHAWNHRPHVAEFWRQDWPLERWKAELETQRAGDHSLPCLLDLDGAPLAYLEIYRVARDRLAAYCTPAPHDLGVHIAIGDVSRTGRGLGRRALEVVSAGLLAADPESERVYAEPDVGNVASIRAFSAAGFESHGEITLPDKTALLMSRGRRTRRSSTDRPPHPGVS